MRVLFFADIFGRPGRKAVAAALPALKAEFAPDFIIGNAENLAGGRGTNHRSFQQILQLGFNGLTSGNHVWDNREVFQILDKDARLLRPANFPSPPSAPCPGKGFGIFESNGFSICVINLLGRVFMADLECPFMTVDRILADVPKGIPILVDMHAEATSEKNAMGWYLDGRVSAVVGSHSHVQTADERLLPQGTAYITDVGMSGAYDSVIGLNAKQVIQRMITKRPFPYDAATENLGVSCVVIEIGSDCKATNIVRIRRTGLGEAREGNEADND